jgi:hypothetical protein
MNRQQWRSLLFENNTSRRHFCAVSHRVEEVEEEQLKDAGLSTSIFELLLFGLPRQRKPAGA